MRKITLTAWFVILFGFYVAYERLNTSQAVVVAPAVQEPVATTSAPVPAAVAVATPTKTTPAPASNPAPTTTTPAPAKAPASAPSPAPVATPKPAGQYKDGTYTGGVADAYYGNVQVSATIQGGKITNVTFLDHPQTHQTSVYINAQAMPYLTQEAIQAQSANVNIVSGATFTSQAFMQSLASALTQAKNS